METPAAVEGAIETLAIALEALAEASNDSSAGHSARRYATALRVGPSTQMEIVLQRLRNDLSVKSDLTDGLDQCPEYWRCFEAVNQASRFAINKLVALRRPDLAFLT